MQKVKDYKPGFKSTAAFYKTPKKQRKASSNYRDKSPNLSRDKSGSGIEKYDYLRSMFNAKPDLKSSTKSPPALSPTSNHRLVTKRVIKSGSNKGHLYMLKSPKSVKTPHVGSNYH